MGTHLSFDLLPPLLFFPWAVGAAINPFVPSLLLLSASSQAGHGGRREAGVSLGSGDGEEQHFPSSLPEPLSPILQLPENT